MNKLECEVVSITGDHSGISPEPVQPIAFGLSMDEIEHRIAQAYMRLVFRTGNARGSRTVSVTQSGLIEVQMTEMPPAILTPGMPLFLLEIFSLPSHSSVDSYGCFDLNRRNWLPPPSSSWRLHVRPKA
jgi:hypothetical protein